MTIVTTHDIHVDERESPFLDHLGPYTIHNLDSRAYKTKKLLVVFFPSVLDFRTERAMPGF